MWIVAAVLLGAFVLLVALGLHTGPHSHLLGALAGGLAAIWLVIMAAAGEGRALLWLLLGLDVLASCAVGLGARAVLRHPPGRMRTGSITGRRGVALSDLAPDGIVRVAGEDWSATSLNGRVARGEAIEVVDARGVRIEVWGTGRDHLGPGNEWPEHPGERKVDAPWS